MTHSRTVAAFCSGARITGFLWLAGCATLTNSSSHEVAFDVQPHGSTVVIKDQKGPEVYRGPANEVSLKRGKDYQVTISKNGYADAVVQIPSGLNLWTFGNVILVVPIFVGVLVGVDAMSGCLWSMNNDDIHVRLVEKDAPATPAPVLAPTAPAEPPPSSHPAPTEPAATAN